MNIFAKSLVSSSYANGGNIIFAVLLLIVSSAAVWAANAHYKKGPSCIDGGLTATCAGSRTGLGNGNVIITVSFPNATGTTTCTNPGGNPSARPESSRPC